MTCSVTITQNLWKYLESDISGFQSQYVGHLSTFTFVSPHCDVSRLSLSSIGEASDMLLPCRYIIFICLLTTSNFSCSMITYSCHLICVWTPKFVWILLFTCFIRYVICLLMYCMPFCFFTPWKRSLIVWLLFKKIVVIYLLCWNKQKSPPNISWCGSYESISDHTNPIICLF